MFKVTISNPNAIKYGSPWSASENEDGSPFTEQDANAWLVKQIGKPWRMPERTITNEDGSITVIPAEFTVDGPHDLSQDKEYQEKLALKKRKSEYPTIEEFFIAYIYDRKGDDSKMNELISKVDMVDTKYPLPEKIKIK